MNHFRPWVGACLALGVLIAATRPVLAADAAVQPGFSATPPAAGPKIPTDRGFMVPYKATIPGTDATFEMIPIPGGKFRLGSPAAEKGRSAEEGPQVEIEVEPFWMGKYEVTWAEYKQFMSMTDIFKAFESAKIRALDKNNEADAVTTPSNLYDPTFTFTNGEEDNLPAATMSQHSAKQYTKWLSKLTGQVYRIPAAAEWEYACRAGTTTAYFFGDDPARLDQYAWFTANSKETTHPVGQKQPNPWGLYDMYGNVSEWVFDEPRANGYQHLAGKTVKAWDSIAWPTKVFPRSLKGGAWDSEAADCRSAALRRSNDTEWYVEDPNLPKSPWWFTEEPALGVGFRLVRPLNPPPAEQLKKAWEADLEKIRDDETTRLSQGRGARAPVDTALPAAIKKLKGEGQ